MSLWGVIYKSTKTEIKIVVTTLGVLFILPLFAVVVIANAGIAEVVHALVSLNPITHLVEIHDANGKLVNTVQVSTVWPVNGVVTLEFGQNDLPYQLYHTGIDIANRHKQIGDPVTPFMAGTVIDARTVTGYGNYVMIDNGNNIVSIYGHLSQILTSKGQSVKPGDIIGLEGMTGYATGPHVHFEIRVYGIPVNPRLFMVGNPELGP
jgi:murein DD-endopeptidase MepM/ murein hydrolase activator NlpD